MELLRRSGLAKKGIEKKVPHSGTKLEMLETVDLINWWGRLGVIRAMFPLLAIAVAVAVEADPASLGSFSTESTSLAVGTALFVFMVVRFGKPSR